MAEHAMTAAMSDEAHISPGAFRRSLVIGLIGFLTLVDLFATQAILPALARNYSVTPAQIGVAANASTIGMAIAGLLVGALGQDLDRRKGVWFSLALLAIPTTLLASASNLTVFALLRIVQGLCMASAFTLTLAYLGERCSKADAAGALAAYVTGGVASNLIGRLCAATVASYAGAGATFYFFAALNLAGALLAWVTLTGVQPMMAMAEPGRHLWSAWAAHLRNAELRRAFVIGFLILFGFIGTFTYIGFVLAAPPLTLSMMATGFVFFVFLPSMVTTPLAGAVVTRFGAALVLLTLRVEWKQAALQRILAESILQLQPALTPPWLALAASRITWQLPDLVPVRAAVARPRFAMPTAMATEPLPPIGAPPARLSPASLRVSDLAPVHQPSLRMTGSITPTAALATAMPTPIRIRQPIYPRNALLRGIEGQVVVEFGLAADGSVQDMRVIRAEPAGVFDQSAIQAMRSWKYALPAGMPTRARYRQTMAFMMNAATAAGGSSGAYTGDEIHAKADCEIVTGTHICRWPDDMGPRVTVAHTVIGQ